MKRPAHLIARSRRLRHDATWPEKVLWSKLRDGNLDGFKFRRQHPMLGHILDFACVEARIAVEVDGASHDSTREDADKRKEQLLAENNWLLLRVTNKELYHHLDQFLDQVLRLCQERVGHAPE